MEESDGGGEGDVESIGRKKEKTDVTERRRESSTPFLLRAPFLLSPHPPPDQTEMLHLCMCALRKPKPFAEREREREREKERAKAKAKQKKNGH